MENSLTSGQTTPPSLTYPHIYQTIFLNKQMSTQWTKGEIDKSKIILEKCWKQQGHNWTHYLGTVPWLWTINGKNQTHFAGGWGLVNSKHVSLPLYVRQITESNGSFLVHEGK